MQLNRFPVRHAQHHMMGPYPEQTDRNFSFDLVKIRSDFRNFIPHWASMKESGSLDALDRKILACIQDHPDLAIAELADRVGLSQTPCWRRLKRLQENGTITGRAWLLDPARLGLSVTVFAALRLGKHDEDTLNKLEMEAGARPEIIECFSMSGESDYLLRIAVQSVEHYEKLLKKVLLHLPGVASISSSFALKAVKITTKLPV